MADRPSGHPAAEADHAPDVAPLSGYTVVVASDRRRHTVADLLTSAGARTIGIQAARSVPKPDDTVLRQATAECLAGRVDDLVVSSALGVRAWLNAARQWGHGDQLLARFGAARVLARDASAADTLRGWGITTVYSTAEERTEELLRYLLSERPAGRRVVVQTHRLTLADACGALRDAGATVVEVPTYTTAGPAELYSLRRLCDLVVRRQVDALALVGAAPGEHLRAQAQRDDRLTALSQALHSDVLCAALGPLSEAPLAAVRPVVASHPFPPYLAETLLTRLPPRAVTVHAAGHRVELRGHAIVLDGQLVPVQAGPLAVLRALARCPGEVRSAGELRATLGNPDEIDDHAVEMAVSRLRRTLRQARRGAGGGGELVETIVRHGYRLAP